MIWGYKMNLLQGQVFACTKEGLCAVADDIFRCIQPKVMHPEQQNVLSREYLIKI